jgi:dienelactone hydrolase
MRTVLIILIVSIVTGIPNRVSAASWQQDKNDPFTPYLTGKAPVIEEDLGTETTAEGIRIRKLVFRSRMIATNEGEKPSLVYAAIAFPAGSGPFPGMVRLHGGGGSADIPAAISSAKAGYASLVLDIPGIAGGKTKNEKTTGPWNDFPKIGAKPDATHSALFDAVLASIQSVYLLRAEPGVDPHKICVAGASWGGYTATMVAAILDKDLVATWSVFGSGNFVLGAYEKDHVLKLPDGERQTWQKWLDPGTRAHNITKPYFISTASNDRHWSWMAVQATLADMKGPVNQFYSPNDNHAMNYPGAKNMLHFFDYYVKNTAPPLLKVTAGKTKRQKDGQVELSFTVKDATTVIDTKIYYCDAAPVWTERKWVAVEAKADGKQYKAMIPSGIADRPFDWYAIAADENSKAWGTEKPVCSSLIQSVK